MLAELGWHMANLICDFIVSGISLRRTGRMKQRYTNDRIGAAGCSCSSWSKILFSLAFPSSTHYDSQKPTRHALICEKPKRRLLSCHSSVTFGYVVAKVLRYCRQHMPSVSLEGGGLRPLPPLCLLAVAFADLPDEGTRNHTIRHGVTA
ncbi:hypothetical protein TGAM01_v207741 [Trichoderma gamsii]|uniref:Uncharacterized protein n=1 Tax=Trichoderma gamsii TaxID=398673 RepID=A0A2P4ZGW2_9HYPO|nr:hypothetical protein TGAM01_v207741 [Trichoderma gamsii]PON23507.1 hypothetical protein TGAM01_v207741 [Trichoderma gamsii]